MKVAQLAARRKARRCEDRGKKSICSMHAEMPS